MNHLAPFLLTVMLKQCLVRAGGTVVTTSSRASSTRNAAVDVDGLDLAAQLWDCSTRLCGLQPSGA